VNSPILPPETGPEAADPPPDDVLAGEFVLGVLDTTQRRQLQARIQTDRAFARRVEEWERRLAPLLADIQPVAVPASIWTAVCARLGWTEPEPEPETLAIGFWQRLGFWRAATVFASVVAIAAIAFTLDRSLLPALQPAQQQAEGPTKPVTPLQHDDGTPGWLASVDTEKGTVLMVPVPAAPDAQGRVPELWLIPAGKAPVSLGAVSTNRSHIVTVPPNARAALVAGSILAITLESAAGIPHAAPTSAVIAKGTIQPQSAS
jgi:anti-sigma-K factor RskA